MRDRYNAVRVRSCVRERNVVKTLWESAPIALLRRNGESYEAATNRALSSAHLRLGRRYTRPITMLGTAPRAAIADSHLHHAASWLEGVLVTASIDECHVGPITPVMLLDAPMHPQRAAA